MIASGALPLARQSTALALSFRCLAGDNAFTGP